MKKTIAIYIIVFIGLLGCSATKNTSKFEDNWESLSNYDETAEWFKDASLFYLSVQ